MVENFAAGGAAINQICVANDLGLKIFDLALDYPTGDITCEPALSERDCAATMAFGMEAIAGGTDLLCVGEMGIGNTTIAAAINLALYGGTAEEWTGPGTGSEGDVMARKIAAVKAAVEFHKDHLSDPLEIMRRLGGREIAAIAGAILAARVQRIPVLIDGYVATAAAALLKAANSSALDHCLIGHVSGEPGHLAAIESLARRRFWRLECVLAKAPVRPLPPASSRPPPPAIPAWRRLRQQVSTHASPRPPIIEAEDGRDAAHATARTGLS